MGMIFGRWRGKESQEECGWVLFPRPTSLPPQAFGYLHRGTTEALHKFPPPLG